MFNLINIDNILGIFENTYLFFLSGNLIIFYLN